MLDRRVCFQDIFEGEIVFEKTITVNELRKLFSYENVEYLLKYLENNIKDSKVLTSGFITNLKELQLVRIKRRE